MAFSGPRKASLNQNLLRFHFLPAKMHGPPLCVSSRVVDNDVVGRQMEVRKAGKGSTWSRRLHDSAVLEIYMTPCLSREEDMLLPSSLNE